MGGDGVPPPRDDLPVAPFQEAAAPSTAAVADTASGDGLKLIFLDIDGGVPRPALCPPAWPLLPKRITNHICCSAGRWPGMHGLGGP